MAHPRRMPFRGSLSMVHAWDLAVEILRSVCMSGSSSVIHLSWVPLAGSKLCLEAGHAGVET